MDDFQGVTGAQGDGGVGGAGDDFAVALDGDFAGVQIKLGEQSGEGEGGRDVQRLAVHRACDQVDGGAHGGIIGRGGGGCKGGKLCETKGLCYRAEMATRPIYVLNGPNLNLLGVREPEVYGSGTLDDLETLCAETAEGLGLAIDFRQSNLEGELIGWVQEARTRAAAVVINPAGYSHTSIALMDALLAVELPVIEVHLSNIHNREAFRAHSYVSRAAQGVICGLGFAGYRLALIALSDMLEEDQ